MSGPASRLARRLDDLNPFRTPEARRLAMLFAVVYFAQGMWNLPQQTITVLFKESLGLNAGQIATFFSISTIPWLCKPLYGLVSDARPLFGRRRKGYLLLASALAAGAALAAALSGGGADYGRLALLFTVMGLGLAFADVMADALMVESGRPLGLTGAFQSVQWAAIYLAAMVVGVAGGALAETRSLRLAFAAAACFPVLTFIMAWLVVREAPAPGDREAFRRAAAAIRAALRGRELWIVAGFIFFWNFSPSIGPALFFYQTDTLKFGQQFIGTLGAIGSAGAVAGAFTFAPLSRRLALRRQIELAILLGSAGSLLYVGYGGPWSAMAIDLAYGWVYMVTTLAFLDLAAKACPRHAEGTFFALLMSVNNAGMQTSQMAGGYLYEWIGYTPLVLVSAAFTLCAWPLVRFIQIDRIEEKARAETTAVATSG